MFKKSPEILARKIKLAFLINTLGGGGAEKVVLDICRQVNKQIFDVYVLYWTDGSFLEDFKKIPEINLLKLRTSVTKGDNFLKELIAFFKIQLELRQLYRKYRWNILHSQLGREDANASILKRQFPHLKIISTKQNIDPIRQKFLGRLIFGFFNRNFDRIVSGSNLIKIFTAQYEFYPLRKIQTIYNGVDLSIVQKAQRRSYKFINPDEFTIITAGRLNTQKGFPHLILAFKEFTEMVQNSRLLICGEGEEKKSLKSLIAKEQIGDKVVFIGWRADLHDLFKSCDVFAMLSNWEGLSMSFLEAMAAGLPVIGSNQDFMKEEVFDGKNGFLVDRLNPNDCAAKFYQLYEDPELRSQMGQAGINLVKTRFSVQNMTTKYEQLYMKLQGTNE